VQIIKKDRSCTGILEFGTEIVQSADSSMVALLAPHPAPRRRPGSWCACSRPASPTPSSRREWSRKLRQIIPSWGQSLIDDAALCDKLRAETAAVLHLNTI
jgi:malate dehydrogenase (quinone)